MFLWHAVLLGAVQGLTEFLPVSSTAHLLVCRTWLGHTHPEDAFTVVVQMGTLAAVYGYFRREIVALLRAVWTDAKLLEVGSTPTSRLAWLIVLGSIPAGAAGLLLKKWLKATFYNLPAMGAVAIVFALLMLASEWWARRRPGRGEDQIGAMDALWVGVWQALALMPGGSRSGCTITGGLFAGFTREAATRFSFLLSVPIITAAGLKELYDEYRKLKVPDLEGVPSLFASGDQLAALAVGTVVAAVVGYLAIAGLLAFLRRYSTGVFVVYRVVFGVILILAAGRGGAVRVSAETPTTASSAPRGDGDGHSPLATPPDTCTVRGQVIWRKKVALPALRPITEALWPGVPSGTVDEYLRVDPTTRGVGNVVVWLIDDPIRRPDRPLRAERPDHTPTAHTLVAGPWQFRPRVLTVRAGDQVRVAPSDPNLRILVEDAERTDLGTLPVTRTPLAVTSPPRDWMKAWVWAFDHPYYTVTGSDGRFVISGVPPGPRRLVVWHELGYHRQQAGGHPLMVPQAEGVEVPAIELYVD